ncbi:hypothetical protein LTR05_006859 [Lithohypha guttulata]|uniref:SUN domain-containing protein n=1 Tax=Lithohypha guttulata TaxID=1690604 RepID=A0AAN7SVX8_9EURO|nr:hypothetical protein LTR05_006859 [Lithohypha guttulata]
MARTLRAIVQVLLFASAVSQSSDTGHLTSSSSSFCPSRTVNYITHKLPQQCLATSRAVNSSPTQAVSNSTTVAEIAETSTSISNLDPQEPQLKTVSAPLITLTATTLHESFRQPHATVVIEGHTPKELAIPDDTLSEDSALESGNFLSFEEWKKQNLKKAGQSEHIAQRDQGDGHEPRQRPAGVHNSLEVLGEDGEIDLDFSGFVPGHEKSFLETSRPVTGSQASEAEVTSDTKSGGKRRSKDAGRTSKERFNYASFDCAANFKKSNKEAKSAQAVLSENKDSYMLNQCSAQEKFIILELCNDILIDTVVLANFEFFSSTFRTFKVSVSDAYPVKVEKWKTLGVYEARNTREIQAFLVEDPIIWARYLRIEFLTHYGNEFYCPVSLVRVHGTTMMEDWKHYQGSASGEDSEEDEQVSAEEAVVDGSIIEVVAESASISSDTDATSITILHPEASQLPEDVEEASIQEVMPHTDTSTASIPPVEAVMSALASSSTCVPEDHTTDLQSGGRITSERSSIKAKTTLSGSSEIGSQPTANAMPSSSSTSTKSAKVQHAISSDIKNVTEHNSHEIATGAASMENSSQVSPNTTPATKNLNTTNISSASTMKPASSAVSLDKSRVSSTATQAQLAAPTTQDSFFKAVQKRVQMLEANSSLSLQYIEDQSRALRDAFKKVEQRQLARTSNFLDQLNQTVLIELREFRQQYDQLWQSTVIELEMQRERYEHDNKAINVRIGLLADEVIFQRRMAIMQMVLIVVCLVLVLFSRGTISNYLELPIVQNVLSRSPSSRWLNKSTDTTRRPLEPLHTRPAHQLRSERGGILKGHQRMRSEDSITDTQSGNDNYAPPTPVSDYGQRDELLSKDEINDPFDSEKEAAKYEDPEFDPSTIERPATSPPTLRVNGGSSSIAGTIEMSEDDVDSPVANRLLSHPATDQFLQHPLALHDESSVSKHLSWDLPDG